MTLTFKVDPDELAYQGVTKHRTAHTARTARTARGALTASVTKHRTARTARTARTETPHRTAPRTPRAPRVRTHHPHRVVKRGVRRATTSTVACVGIAVYRRRLKNKTMTCCRSRANIQPFCHNMLSGQTHRQTERQMGYATGPPDSLIDCSFSVV